MILHEDKDKSTKVLGKAYRKELIVSIDRLIKERSSVWDYSTLKSCLTERHHSSYWMKDIIPQYDL